MTGAEANSWIEVEAGLFRFVDSCMVYAVDIGGGMLVINAGGGAWLDHIDELPSPIRALVLTHFFRDHSAGASLAAQHDIEVWAPYWEQEQLSDSEGLFARRETYIIYDNNWDLFAPTVSIPVTRWLQDFEQFDVGSATIDIVPAPGASIGAIGIGVTFAGKRILFAGEAIHAHGQILRIAPLQYNYNDLPGAANLLYTLARFRDWKPEFIVSSTGRDLIEQPKLAISALEVNLRSALAGRPETSPLIAAATEDAIDEITPHLFQSRHAVASTYFLVSESGKALSIDYGYRGGLGTYGNYPYPRNRRALIHGLDALKERTGIDRIDTVLLTHFHDDHVNGVPTLQRLHGTKCVAADNFAFLLAAPERYAFPCTWPEAIDIEPLDTNRPFVWEEYEFHLHPISGHTRFSTLIEFVADDTKIVATGDQYFFIDFGPPAASAGMHNHVYRNGAMLESFDESTALMKNIEPEIVLPGHGPAYRVTDEFFPRIDEYTEAYGKIHRDLMPLMENDVHFEVDSRAAWIEPYRVQLDSARPIEFTVHVRNPYPHSEKFTLRAIIPKEWKSEDVAIRLDSRGEGEVQIVVEPSPGMVCRRQAVAIELIGPDRSFGQMAEALVTIGYDRF